MKYVESYYPVHYLSISGEAPVPAAARLSLIVPRAEGGPAAPHPTATRRDGHPGPAALARGGGGVSEAKHRPCHKARAELHSRGKARAGGGRLPAPSRATAPVAPWGGSSPLGPDPQPGRRPPWEDGFVGEQDRRSDPLGYAAPQWERLCKPLWLWPGMLLRPGAPMLQLPLCFACCGKIGHLEGGFRATD